MRTFLLLMAAISPLSGETPFTYNLPPSTHGVGLRVVLQYDYSRTYRGLVDIAGHPYDGERARPIETLIWYPSESHAGTHFKYGDYLALFATEENFTPSPAQTALTLEGHRRQFEVDPEAPMHAVRDAKPDSGRYPVVIYAPSFSAAAFENADLCEYLASHGYVVIASPDMGMRTRNMTNDRDGVEAQAQDISFLIGFARTLPQADTSAIAVAGFSWGGISNLFAAARDNRVKALVSLDGSARYFPKIVEETKYVVPENLTLPVIFFTQKNMSLEELAKNGMATTGNVLNRLTHCDVTLVHMQAMQHGHFSSLFDRSANMWKQFPRGDYTPEEISESFGWVVQYTERFLSAKLKKDAAAAEFLLASPAKNGVHPHLLSVETHSAKGTPATFDGFVSELGAKGFDHAGEVYDAMKSNDKDFKIEESKINNWGYDLLTHGYNTEAVEAFKLNVKLYPESWNAYDSLADGYERNGQKDMAMKFFEKTLEMNAKNDNARTHLAKLKEAAKLKEGAGK